MKKILFLLLCLLTISCSAYNNHGLLGKKKPQTRSKVYYHKNLKSNKVLYKKYKRGTKIMILKEKKEWSYSRNKSVTHRNALKNSGGYDE